MASKEKGNNPSSASEGSIDENTILGDATGAKRDPPKEPDIPSGASGIDENGKKIRPPQTTSTPKGGDAANPGYEQFYTEEEWETRTKYINSLNPKELGHYRQNATRIFKQLLHGTVQQENVESTWKSINKYYFLVSYCLSITTATREEFRQLDEMREQIDKFRRDYNIAKGQYEQFTTAAEDVILKHNLSFPGHVKAQEHHSVGPKSTSEIERERHLRDWIDRVPEGVYDTKEMFRVATNNFLSFYKRKIENILKEDSSPKGFVEIFHQLEKHYLKVEKTYYNIEQEGTDQDLMVFIEKKYNDVKDYVANWKEIDQEEREEDSFDVEIDLILKELKDFADSATVLRRKWPTSELGYLLCNRITEGVETELREDLDGELIRLLQSFGKDRLKQTLHLWKSRFNDKTDAYKEVSNLLSYLVKNWDMPEEADNGSTWAAHATRFTRGNVPNNSLNDKFSVFIDPPRNEQEESTEESDDGGVGANASPQYHPRNGVRRQPSVVERQRIAAPRQPIPAPRNSILSGLGNRQRSSSQPDRASRRETTTLRTTQQTTTVNENQFERLLDLFERRSGGSKINHSAIKLPQLKIPLFDGNPLEWINWWPRYEAHIHSRKDISDSHKLLYLQQFVTEKAAKELWGAKIQTLPYNKAIRILFDKYDDRELLTGIYIDQLTKITLPTSMRDVPGIRNFVDEVKKYMNCLREFGMMPQFYSLSTMHFYRAKMPLDLLHEMADQERKKLSKLTLVDFTKALTKYADLREDTSRFREHVGAKNNNHNTKSPTTTMLTQTGSNRNNMNPSSNPSTNKSYYKCLFCGTKGINGHMMADCPTVKDPKKRLEIIQGLGRCTCCLSKDHRFFECPSKKTCFCMRKHHSSLHDYFANLRSGNQNNHRNQREPRQQDGNQNRNNANNRSQPSGN